MVTGHVVVERASVGSIHTECYFLCAQEIVWQAFGITSWHGFAKLGYMLSLSRHKILPDNEVKICQMNGSDQTLSLDSVLVIVVADQSLYSVTGRAVEIRSGKQS